MSRILDLQPLSERWGILWTDLTPDNFSSLHDDDVLRVLDNCQTVKWQLGSSSSERGCHYLQRVRSEADVPLGRDTSRAPEPLLLPAQLGACPHRTLEFSSAFALPGMRSQCRNVLQWWEPSFAAPIVAAARHIIATEPSFVAVGGSYSCLHFRAGDGGFVNTDRLVREIGPEIEKLPENSAIFVSTDVSLESVHTKLPQLRRLQVLSWPPASQDPESPFDAASLLDLPTQLNADATMFLQQQLCACASIAFFGTDGSSFSARIEVLRSLHSCTV